jgi:tRNA-splicing ligase RtcB (3'-phosphate/5'-hydroxy nucleic acid ligase)
MDMARNGVPSKKGTAPSVPLKGKVPVSSGKKISDVEWEIPAEGDMKVPGRIFASEELMNLIKDDKSLEQVKNVAKLPGILKASYAMPDMHQGYGFPIGGVAAFDVETGVISPGGVGYDINCSVRLLRTNLKAEDLKGKEQEIAHSLFRSVPSGVGRGGKLKLDKKELDEVLKGGAQWAVQKGYGSRDDWLHIEDQGKLGGANPENVSQRAKARGMPQLGSLGAGNHFLDVLVVDEVFDKDVAKVFGLELGQVVILIHCGSRGLGHQVASDYISLMDQEYGHPDFDRELVHAPITSEVGKNYLSAMNCAANFAFANKQLITHFVREDMKHYFPDFKAEVVYDICHNIAKFEEHDISNSLIPESSDEDSSHPTLIANAKRSRFANSSNPGKKTVLVMRKGATRSFGPGREEIPEDYRKVGQPVLIPGSMGTPSYVLVGTKEAEEKSFGSTAHGAGRVRSRTEAHRKMSFEDAKKDMAKRGVFVEFGGQKGMVEESPFSYKDIDEVVRVSDEAGIGRKVVKLVPKLVVIG